MFKFYVTDLYSYPPRCKICGLAVLFTSDTLHTHLMSNHNLTLHIYRQQYLNRAPRRRSSNSRGLPSTSNEAEQAEQDILPALPVLQQKEPESIEECVTESGGSGGAGGAAAAPESLSPDGLDTRRLESDISADGQQIFSDNPVDMCRLECNMCQTPVKVLRAHVQKHHDISFRDFRKIFPQEIYAVKTYHRYLFY